MRKTLTVQCRMSTQMLAAVNQVASAQGLSRSGAVRELLGVALRSLDLWPPPCQRATRRHSSGDGEA